MTPDKRRKRLSSSLGNFTFTLGLELFLPGRRAKKSEGVICYFALQAGPLRLLSGRLIERPDGSRYVAGPAFQRQVRGRSQWTYLWRIMDPDLDGTILRAAEGLLAEAQACPTTTRLTASSRTSAGA